MKPNRYLFRAFSLVGISLLSLLLVSTTGASAHDVSQYTPVTTDQNQNNNNDNNDDNNDDNNNNDNNNNGGGGYIPGGIPGGGSSNNNNGGGISAGGATAGTTTNNDGSSATVAANSQLQTGNVQGENTSSNVNSTELPASSVKSQKTQPNSSDKSSINKSPIGNNDRDNTGLKKTRTQTSKTYEIQQKSQRSTTNDISVTPDTNTGTGSGGNWHWKYWYRGPNGEANSKVDKDMEVFARSFWDEYRSTPGKSKETTIKVRLAKSMVEKNKSGHSKLVRTIKAIERRKHLYYSVTHYRDNDGLASYTLTVVKFYLNKKHTRYVGHKNFVETHNL